MLELILLGAIIGGFLAVLGYQLTRMLIANQVPLDDIDAIVKGLFDLEFDKAFWTKIALGTAIGAGGAFLSLGTLASGAPVGSDVTGLILYGAAWGFAGNGIIYILKMVPANVFTIQKLNATVKALKAENAGLKEQNQVLKMNAEMFAKNGGETPLK